MWYDIWYFLLDMLWGFVLLWDFVLYALFALWIFIDAKKRMNHVLGWPLAILFLGPLAYVLNWPLVILFGGLIVLMAIYLAKRNLKKGEVRSGGTGWNILKYFAALWTIAIAVSSIWSLLEIPDLVRQQYDFVIEQTEDTIVGTVVEDTIIGTAVLTSLGNVLLYMVRCSHWCLGSWFDPKGLQYCGKRADGTSSEYRMSR